MENQQEKKGLFAPSLNFGLLMGVIMIALSFVFYLMGPQAAKIGGYIGYLVQIGILVFAMLQYRKMQEGEFLSYGNALGLGVLTSLVAGVLVAIYTFVFFQYIAPGEIERLLLEAENAMIAANPNMTDEQIDMGLKITTWMLNPIAMVFMAIIGTVFSGTIFSLIIAAFVKRNNPDASFQA